MYKIIIADDEAPVRDRLINLVKKLGNEYQIVGSFENGYDALEGISVLEPDILITDIKMPYINGIELIREAVQSLPNLECIIISGFDSFDYAKQAIELGVVVGYISKPISFEELKSIIDKAKADLIKKKEIKTNLSILEHQTNVSSKLLQEADFNKLLSMKLIPENFLKRLEASGINTNRKNMWLIEFDFDVEAEKMSFSEVENVNKIIPICIDDELKGLCEYITFLRSDNYFVYISTDSDISDELIESSLKRIINDILISSSVSVSCACERVLKEEAGPNFRRTYRHLLRALEYRTVIGKNKVINYTDIEKEAVSVGKIDDNELKRLTYDLNYGNIDEVKLRMHNILKTILNKDYVDSYSFILMNIVSALLKACSSFKDLYSSYLPNDEILQSVISCKSYEALAKQFDNLIMAIYEVNNNVRTSGVEASLKQVLDYIDINYANFDISLEKVADVLGFSVSYISLLLKRNNTSFTKYLTKKRMEKAKELLVNPSNKIISIAYEIGYNDPYYFSHCFKKFYGVSPVDYRKK